MREGKREGAYGSGVSFDNVIQWVIMHERYNTKIEVQ